MGKVTLQRGFDKRLRRKLQQRRETVLAAGTGVALNEIMKDTPVEFGHAHEAWLAAADDAAAILDEGQLVTRQVAKHYSSGSGDPTAKKNGSAEKSGTEDTTKIRVNNDLGFVRALEHGGTIKPISPGGHKVGGKSTIGKLYAPRAPRAQTGPGILQYYDAHKRRIRELKRVVSPGFHVAKALDATIYIMRATGVQAR